MPVITNIEDLRRLYKRRAPKMFFDYCETGSWTEQTFHDNTEDFRKLRLRQRVAVDMSNRNLKTKMIGQETSMPVALAPVGMTGMQHADGEILAAQAAEEFGVPFTLSTMSICSIEDVREHTKAPFWFQLYVMKDEEFVDNIIARAKNAGCSALVITLDLQILGQRHKDLKNGLSAPPRLTLPVLADLATKWRWGLGMARTPRREFRNIVGHARDVENARSLMSWTAENFEPKLDWSMIARLKEKWGGKVILKGILDPRDARRAVETGCDAIVVSNHGGRQLDGAPSAITMLPSILREVSGETEVFFDSGIRSGQDVLKAMALGASGCMIGRAYIYGLGAMGRAGVTAALETIRNELDISMALCGHRDISQIDRDILHIPADFEGNWT